MMTLLLISLSNEMRSSFSISFLSFDSFDVNLTLSIPFSINPLNNKIENSIKGTLSRFFVMYLLRNGPNKNLWR